MARSKGFKAARKAELKARFDEQVDREEFVLVPLGDSRDDIQASFRLFCATIGSGVIPWFHAFPEDNELYMGFDLAPGAGLSRNDVLVALHGAFKKAASPTAKDKGPRQTAADKVLKKTLTKLPSGEEVNGVTVGWCDESFTARASSTPPKEDREKSMDKAIFRGIDAAKRVLSVRFENKNIKLEYAGDDERLVDLITHHVPPREISLTYTQTAKGRTITDEELLRILLQVYAP